MSEQIFKKALILTTITAALSIMNGYAASDEELVARGDRGGGGGGREGHYEGGHGDHNNWDHGDHNGNWNHNDNWNHGGYYGGGYYGGGWGGDAYYNDVEPVYVPEDNSNAYYYDYPQ